MGATAFRPKKTARGQYKGRKARRLAGHPMSSRMNEPAPWYCFPLTAGAYEAKLNADRIAAEQERRRRDEEARQKRDEAIALLEQRAKRQTFPRSYTAAERERAELIA